MGSWLRARRPVRSATGLLAVALVMVVADTWSSHASTTFAFSRLAGSDRYETAKIIAEQTFASSGGAILATGERFPDALGGGYAAGVAHAPILLTTGATLPPVTVTALRDLNVTRVAILGGTAAVATAVEVDLNSRGYQTARIAGVDRYDTAKRVAEIAGPNAVGTIGGARVAIVASGEDAHFPDALSASPMADARHFPVLLTTTDTLAPAARAGLSDLGIKQALVVGGPAAVSNSVVTEIRQMGIVVQQFSGQDRTDTAGQVADFERANLGFTDAHIDLARGDLFPDSLTGGVHSGNEQAPVLLTESPSTLGNFTANWLAAHAQPLRDGHIFGGDAAVNSATQAEAERIVRDNSLVPCSMTPTTAPCATTSAGPQPPAMRFVSASAQNGATTLTVTFSHQALCPTVDSDGSDFRAAVIAGPNQGSVPFVKATCPDILDQTVSLTVADGVQFVSGQTIEVFAKFGTDGNTVTDAGGNAQPDGNSVMAVVP